MEHVPGHQHGHQRLGLQQSEVLAQAVARALAEGVEGVGVQCGHVGLIQPTFGAEDVGIRAPGVGVAVDAVLGDVQHLVADVVALQSVCVWGGGGMTKPVSDLV